MANKVVRGKDVNQRRIQRTGNSTADWGEARPDLLLAVVACVAKQGGALRLGYTSDGGAYAVGVYGDGQPYTDYIRPDEGIDHYLTGMLEIWG